MTNPVTRIGPYEVIAPLGAGGMGEVFRGRDPRIGREVAIKLISPSLAGNPDRLERFESEARAAGALSHPNLVTIFELGSSDDGAPYIAMELLEGKTLREVLDEGAIPPRKAAAYGVQIATGLAAAHEKGIIHRDLKPENIFVTADGRLKILDFGLAKLTAPDGIGNESATMKRQTAPGTVMGTVGYMSPEQIRGQTVDHRTDIFSLGAILYEMLAGRPAFRRETSADTMTAILREEPEELTAVSRQMPAALERVVRHCLEKSPVERFQSARDIAFNLDAMTIASGMSGVQQPMERRRVPWRLIAALLAGIAIGAGAVAAFKPRSIGAVAPQRAMRPLTYSGQDSSPAVSPDGKLIAFSSARDGVRRIWLKQLNGGGERALTEGPDLSPRFSPDGSSILFVRGFLVKSTLYSVPVLGGEPRRILDDVAFGEYSRDGKQIAFTRIDPEGGSNSSVGVMNADGSGVRFLAKRPQSVLGEPRWSPDGKWLAVSDLGFGNYERAPMVYAVADGSPYPGPAIPTSPGIHTSIVWTSDRTFVYAEVESGSNVAGGSGSRVLSHDLVSGQREVIHYVPGPAAAIDITADGRLVADAIVIRQNIREISLDPASPAPLAWLSRGNSIDRQPVYSRDGEWIAFSSNMSGNLDIWAVSTTKGVLRRLTDHAEDDFDPAFTADSKQLVWSSRRSGNYEIWIGGADGSAPRQVSRDGVDAENATATPDGKWLVYASYEPKKRGIWRIHPDGTGAERIVADEVELPELSPDGQYVSYHPVNGDTIRVVRISDRARFEVGHLTPPQLLGTAIGRTRWTADGKALVFTDSNDAGALGIYMQDFIPGTDTNASRRVIVKPDIYANGESFGLSPDGKRIAVSFSEQVGSVLISEPIPALVRMNGER